MRNVWLIILLLLTELGNSQTVESYFEKIRDNEAKLTAFFSQMPKGGDLHHHYSGSVYAEPLIAYAIKNNFYLNLETLEVQAERGKDGIWESFEMINKNGALPMYQQKIIEKWSIKDYNGVSYPSDKLFFESFGKFQAVIKDTFKEGLLELKNRAITENVSYIETQLSTIPCDMNTEDLTPLNQELRLLATQKSEKELFKILDDLYKTLIKREATQYATTFNTDFVAKMHNDLKLDDAQFTMRYQNFVLRFMEPVDLFKNLVIAFISADKSDLIDGVNIVSPEDGETSMKDYQLHMLMYKYCRAKFPKVRYSMHAGELTLGLVQPEELTWHINSAVYTAGANRIGHGVDLGYEKNNYELLRHMAKNKVAIEINLSSNEFILKVKENRHPFSMYKDFGVPIVISTDDAGILRTNLTEQYVLLAKRYPQVSYKDIKEYVFNSIHYSFIEDKKVKDQLVKDIEKRFKTFENQLPLKQL